MMHGRFLHLIKCFPAASLCLIELGAPIGKSGSGSLAALVPVLREPLQDNLWWNNTFHKKDASIILSGQMDHGLAVHPAQERSVE